MRASSASSAKPKGSSKGSSKGSEVTDPAKGGT
eukprot:CAMPEP_0181020804 /NCGR_PEP_ID=MMETSP1070-20121207/644_1 /TAXON_ID=265543 /ORGANISM="Minutocellus polymorphus, Strain NH13" /LENGTH=32 /DNA_ID= /DNA_START= /DNA_END= /DNA_ORIENTATION=